MIYKKKVVLSMTTIPSRKKRLMDNIQSILEQSYQFDVLIINVDDNLNNETYEWYTKLTELDPRIVVNKGESKWRSCNKLLPTLKLYPNDIIITVDDDIYYPKESINELVKEWKKNKNCIIAHEINPIILENDNTYVSYINSYDAKLMQKEWGKYLSNCCLFPPHTFDKTDLYDYDKMMQCTDGTHDELWFWVNSTLNGVQCIGLNYVRSFMPEVLEEYQEGEYRLSNINGEKEKINDYMTRINEMYGEKLIQNILSKPIEIEVTKDNVYSFIYMLPFIKKIYDYGFKVILRNELTKDWKNMVIGIIKEKRQPSI